MAIRAEKEAFVTGHSGTTCWEIALVSSVFTAGFVLYALGGWLVHLREGSAASWAVGVSTILGPALFSCWFPQHALASITSEVHHLNILLPMATFAVILLVSSKQCQKPRVFWTEAQAAQDVHPKACVTLFRAGITAYTCIAILAVDFPFFPRRLAKAETFGTGLMDIGPGMFVFSSGLGLGLRLLRLSSSHQSSKAQSNNSGTSIMKTSSSIQLSNATSTPALLLRAATSVGPLLLLGLARMVLTKAVDYQEHHSEYGVHWNFFFTLACVACMGAVAPLHGTAAASVALAAGALHQVLLLQPGFSEWLGADERDMNSLVDANKEGLVSLGGYAALFYAGSACSRILQSKAINKVEVDPTANSSRTTSSCIDSGTILEAEWKSGSSYLGVSSDNPGMEGCGVMPVCASEKNDAEKKRGSLHRGVLWWHARLWGAAAAGWLLAALCATCVQPVSRRFCNAAYVLWVAAMALTQLAFAALALVAVAVATGVPRPRCVVTEGLSENQLAAFLLANVLTGMVNMFVDTLRAGAGQATAVMIAYCAVWGCTGLWVRSIKRVISGKVRKE